MPCGCGKRNRDGTVTTQRVRQGSFVVIAGGRRYPFSELQAARAWAAEHGGKVMRAH